MLCTHARGPSSLLHAFCHRCSPASGCPPSFPTCRLQFSVRLLLQVVRPDKVATTFPHAPDCAPLAQLVCIGFKDGAEVGMTWQYSRRLLARLRAWTIG